MLAVQGLHLVGYACSSILRKDPKLGTRPSKATVYAKRRRGPWTPGCAHQMYRPKGYRQMALLGICHITGPSQRPWHEFSTSRLAGKADYHVAIFQAHFRLFPIKKKIACEGRYVLYCIYAPSAMLAPFAAFIRMSGFRRKLSVSTIVLGGTKSLRCQNSPSIQIPSSSSLCGSPLDTRMRRRFTVSSGRLSAFRRCDEFCPF